MKITFLGTHNTESKNSRLVTFLLDNTLAVEAGSLTTELSSAQQRAIQAILLSHGHYDHIRNIPSVAFNNSFDLAKPPLTVIGIPRTLEILRSHLIDGIIYPSFADSNSYLGKPVLSLIELEPYRREMVTGYQITALPVNHPLDAVGFEIISPEGKSIFYTGDTGPGLTQLWAHLSPQLIITEATFPSRLHRTADLSGHLCPLTLKKELQEFIKLKKYLPDVVLVHICPEFESEIREEIQVIKTDMNISIKVAAEGSDLYL